MSENASNGLASSEPIPVSYLKSSQFRVIFAEGAYGGPSPRGFISFTLYNERQALPRASEITLSDGGIINEVITDTRGGIVREMEAQVVMRLEEAEELVRWLSTKVAELRNLQGA